MARSTAEKPPMADYRPPQPGFVPCDCCGCPTLIDKAGVAVTPIAGRLHLCGENCACRWLPQPEKE